MSSIVDICNSALAHIGEAPIRALSENNKRARTCAAMYDIARKYMLEKFDWPFAREYKVLVSVATDDLGISVPTGYTVYALPSDCAAPRDLAPFGSREEFLVRGKYLLCKTSTEDSVYLQYTKNETNPTMFSGGFETLLALYIAVRVAPSFTGDKDLIRELKSQLQFETAEVWESEANMDNTYRHYDNNPNNDTFVNPDLATNLTVGSDDAS